MLREITPLILTYNEAPNIARCLDRLAWAERIVIIDSGSTDGTLEIARRYPRVEVVVRPFDDFSSQWNFGLTQVASRWVLSLDADYELSDALVSELGALEEGDLAGYDAAFVYRVYGRRLRASLYPPRTVLFRRQDATHYNEGHTQRIAVTGPIGRLGGKIYHDDRKPLSRWLASQQRYARQEADYLLSKPRAGLRRTERLRLMGWPSPIAVFLYTLLWKRCLLDGWPGWYYVLQRTAAETMIALEIVDRRIGGK